MGRKWIKLWVGESLRGTSRFEFTPAERGVWYDLLLMAGDCREDGNISPGDGKGYPLKWIASTLNIPLPLLKTTLDKCVASDRLTVTEDGVTINNWRRYQSEYERQKAHKDRRGVSDKPY